jgi:hypothetical protein
MDGRPGCRRAVGRSPGVRAALEDWRCGLTPRWDRGRAAVPVALAAICGGTSLRREIVGAVRPQQRTDHFNSRPKEHGQLELIAAREAAELEGLAPGWAGRSRRVGDLNASSLRKEAARYRELRLKCEEIARHPWLPGPPEPAPGPVVEN